MNSTNIVMKWNIVDTIIFSIENLISSFRDFKDDIEPEVLIEAAIKELKEENEELKQYRIPEYAIKLNDSYICPVCKKKLSDIENIKYCSECGKRIILPSKLSTYGTNYVNNLVKDNIQ